jgi:drug/metabolite transporter (DMT)-like permease
VAWSSAGVLTRAIDAGPWPQLFWRAAFAAVCLFCVVAVQARGHVLAPFRALRLPGLAVGVCFAVASSAFILALGRTSVARVLFIQASAPFIAALLARAFLHERLPRSTQAAMGATFLGVCVMLGGSLGGGGAGGDVLALVMAAAFSCAVVLTRGHPEISMTPATCIAMVLAACASVVPAHPLAISHRDLGLLAAFGAGQMCLGLALFAAGARYIPAGEAGLITVLEVVLGPLWVWLAYRERPDGATLVGGSIVLCAVLLHAASEWLGDLRPARAR